MNRQISVFLILGTLFLLTVSVFVFQLNIIGKDNNSGLTRGQTNIILKIYKLILKQISQD